MVSDIHHKHEIERKDKAIMQAITALDASRREIDRLERELEYAYRAINFGFTYGNFDFSILKEAAARFVVNADVAAAKAD